jgi:2-keto-4-pentenoate hydratase/2-oxohepta-3-ene-1,7-dioic acid hydratase in catechol pathway
MDKIICVGKNYLKHAVELGDAVPAEPLFFLKPPSTIFNAADRTQLDLVRGFTIHHEVELVLRLVHLDGQWRFSHYTFGLDLTLRELQNHLKKNGQPWEKAKVFKNSAVLGAWHDMSSMDEILQTEFTLQVNGETRQQGRGMDMRWKPQELLLEVQKWFPLNEGDLLFTGTPEGVGPLQPGDQVEVQGGRVHYNLTCI